MDAHQSEAKASHNDPQSQWKKNHDGDRQMVPDDWVSDRSEAKVVLGQRSSSENKDCCDGPGLGAPDPGAQRRRIIREVREFFFGDVAFEAEVQAWCRARAHLVAPESAGGEQDLRYTAMFGDFSTLLEERVAAAARARCGAGPGDLEAAVSEAAGLGDEDEDRAAVESLMAAVDFETFMVLMRETRRGSPWTLDSMFAR